MSTYSQILTKLLFLFLMFQIGSTNISAQKINGGFIGGLSTSQIDGDTQKGYKKLGFLAGVFVETSFTQVIGLKVELYYIGKGAKQNAGGVEVFKTHLNYVEMPFLLKIVPVDNVEFDLGIGVSYLIAAKMFEYGDEVPASLTDWHNFDFSAIASGSYYFKPNFAFNVRFDYSVVPVKNNPNWFNSNLSFGFLYRFNKN